MDVEVGGGASGARGTGGNVSGCGIGGGGVSAGADSILK